MRPEPNTALDAFRYNDNPEYTSPEGANWGAFFIPVAGGILRVISSGAANDNPYSKVWEHVSVSLKNRTPNWGEMAKVKALFWGDDETVIQFHPRRDQGEYVNLHPNCLHLWKRIDHEYELPPKEFLV